MCIVPQLSKYDVKDLLKRNVQEFVSCSKEAGQFVLQNVCELGVRRKLRHVRDSGPRQRVEDVLVRALASVHACAQGFEELRLDLVCHPHEHVRLHDPRRGAARGWVDEVFCGIRCRTVPSLFFSSLSTGYSKGREFPNSFHKMNTFLYV